MDKRTISLVTVLVLLVFFFSINALSSVALRSARIDLTENKLYTLSDGTKNILAELDEPVKLRFFFSKKLAGDFPDLKSYASRVQELLEEYVAKSDQLTLEVLDPEPYSEEEELAGSFGLRGLPANQAGEALYFGLAATNSTDEEARIPFFQNSREEFLEYDLTQLVYKLSNPKKPTVGLMTGLPLMGPPFDPRNPQAPPTPWFIVEQMQQLSEVRTIPLTVTEIEPDIDVLMVVHPKGITEETLFAIDQYVLGGGKLLAFVDPLAEMEETPPQMQQNPAAVDKSSDLGPLLATWGVDLVPNKLAGDRKLAQRVGWRGQPTDYVVYLGLRAENLDSNDFTTAKLNQFNITTSGILELIDGATTEVTPIATTTEEAMQVDTMAVSMQPDPERLLRDFYSEEKSFHLAVRISGSAKTAFPDGAPEPPPDPEAAEGEEASEEEETPDRPALTDSTGPINVIVVADADLLHESRWVRLQDFFGMRVARPFADNGDFVINALDNLSGSNDLISLRSRGRFNRPFEKKDEIRRDADSRFRQEHDTLQEELRQAEQKLQELQGQKEGASSMILSTEQVAEIEKFREQREITKKRLREVRHQLRKDIEGLGRQLKFLNIFLIPGLICVFAIVMWSYRSRQRG